MEVPSIIGGKTLATIEKDVIIERNIPIHLNHENMEGTLFIESDRLNPDFINLVKFVHNLQPQAWTKEEIKEVFSKEMPHVKISKKD